MNVTIFTSYHEATVAADEWAHDTGITHLVVERFPAGPALDSLYEALVPDDMVRADHRYTVLSEAEWATVADDWDAEVQYAAEAAS